MEIFKANKQWSTRPDDEKFDSLQALYQATKSYADAAVEKDGVPIDTLRAEAINGEVQILGRKRVPAKLTHWAFGQLAQRIGAPASYLRDLPATLATQNINHGLAQRMGGATMSLLFHIQSGEYLLRAMTTDRYERLWNWEVAERLVDLQQHGWEPARPDIRVVDDHPALYASDHDMFAFIRHSQRTVNEPGNPDGLQRGMIVENSEVGASKYRMTRFLYREMCGNHIIWGAENVSEMALRHVGSIRERVQLWDAEIRKYMDSSASDDEAKIAASKSKFIAATKQEVLDAIFGKRIPVLSRKVLDASYEMVEPDTDGSPNTVWGIVQGITRFSQGEVYADKRTELDRAAGKLLDAF